MTVLGKNNLFKRVAAFVLAVLMVFTLVPVNTNVVKADEGDTTPVELPTEYTFTIVDVEGGAFSGATVSVFAPDATEVASNTTDGNSNVLTFGLADLSADSSVTSFEGYTYKVTADGYCVVSGEFGETDDIDVTMIQLRGMKATVTVAEGAAIEGATVELLQDETVKYTASTNAEGEFSFDVVEDGAYTVKLTHKDYKTNTVEVDFTSIPGEYAGVTNNGNNLSMEEKDLATLCVTTADDVTSIEATKTLALTTTVKKADSEEVIDGGKIIFGSSADGIATITETGVVTGVSKGDVKISVSFLHDVYKCTPVEVDLTITDYVEKATLEGSVTLPSGNANCAEAKVYLLASDVQTIPEDFTDAISSTTADVNGKYSFADLPIGGTYKLLVKDTNYISDLVSVEIAADGLEDGGTVTKDLTAKRIIKLDFEKDTLDLNINEAFTQNEFIPTPPGGSDVVGYTFISDKENIVRVNSDTGVIELAGEEGTATISVDIKNKTDYVVLDYATASYTVNVTKIPNPNIDFTDVNLRSDAVEKYFSITGFDSSVNYSGEKTVTYASSNEAAAEIDENGFVTMKTLGTTTITATVPEDGGYAQTVCEYTLTIVQRPQSDLAWDDPSLNGDSEQTMTVVYGSKESFTANVYGIIDNLGGTYSSTNEDVATVDEDGKVTIVGVGNTTIKYVSPDNGDTRYETKTLTFKLVVEAGEQPLSWDEGLTDGKINKVYEDPVFKIDVVVGADSGDKTGLEGSFTSDDTRVATVDPDTGEVTIVGVGDGSATITYTSTDANKNYVTKELTYKVIVQKAKQNSFVWDYNFGNTSNKKTITYGDAVPSILAGGACNEATVTYQSNNSDVVSVDINTGALTVHKAGTVTITATATVPDDGNYVSKPITYTLEVKLAPQTLTFDKPMYAFINGGSYTLPVVSSDKDVFNVKPSGKYIYSIEEDTNGENGTATINSVDGALTFTGRPGTITVKVVREKDDRYDTAMTTYLLTVKEWDAVTAEKPASTYYSFTGTKIDAATPWYTNVDANHPIKLVAKSGYQLYAGTTAPTKSTVWADSVTVMNTHDGTDNGIVYYIKETDTGYISKQYTVNNIHIDTALPSAAIAVDDATIWEKILSFFTFNLAGQDVPKLEITTGDAMSGVKAVYYYISNSLEPLEQNGLIDSVALEKEANWKNYSNVVDLLNENVTENVIYTKVVDNAGHITYASTNGLIFDGAKPIVTPTVVTQDINGLYNGNVEVSVGVIDAAPYSGIKEITYVVENADTVTDRGTLFTFQPAQEGNPKQSELVSAWSSIAYGKNVIVKAADNNSDDVKVTFTVTDNAGNVTESVVTLKIDATAPVISVSYNNNTGDTTFSDGVYYNTNRTATITVKERHFDESKVKLSITNTDGTIPKLSTWTKTSEGTGNKDNATYSATITFSADGDYTFGVSCADAANNTSGKVNYGDSQAPTAFTIDKTAPTISISYDNNDVLNDNYYKADRVATIVINEHNFEASRVNATITATDDGQTIAAPVISGWSSSGDTHTATVSYSADALYTFDIAYSDKAGNAMADVAEQSFYVDKTMPSVSITEIVDQSANNADTIGFVITATDTNFDVFAPELTAVVQTENGFTTTELNVASISEITNGQVYTVENLETDGIYSIKCTVVDKAGNAYTEVSLQHADGSTYVENRAGEDTLLMFSVNRLGSTFAVDENTQNVIDKEYVQQVENDVVIYEVNTNELLSYTVSLNGTELTEGTDYSVSSTGGDGEWMRYTYTLNKSLFEEEGEYVIVISSTDGAENNAFSDIKNVNVSFVVDRTAPVVTVTGMESDRSYQTDKQTVTLMPTDDGGLIETLIVRLVDRDGNVLSELFNMSGDELRELLETNGGTITFELTEGLNQRVQIICSDKAYGVNGQANTFDVTYENVSVSASAMAIFLAGNTPYYIGGGIAGVAGLGAAVTVFLKRRKMPRI